MERLLLIALTGIAASVAAGLTIVEVKIKRMSRGELPGRRGER